MNSKRLSSAERDKQLRLAINRIEHGRARTKATKTTFASVAREAGVSTALIHNHHSDIAELIRSMQGRSSRAQRDAKHADLKDEREKNRELRAKVDELRSQLAKLASINELQAIEIEGLRARLAARNISVHPSGRS